MKTWQAALIAAAQRDGVTDPLPKFGIDGLGGPEVQGAINDFQRRHSLQVTGQFDAPTRAALTPPPVPHVSSLEVAVITAALSNLPFLPQPIKDALMFPALIHTIIALLPQLPDDWSETEKDVAVLASTSASAPDKLDAAGDWATKLGAVLHAAAAAARGTPVATPAVASTPPAAK